MRFLGGDEVVEVVEGYHREVARVSEGRNESGKEVCERRKRG